MAKTHAPSLEERAETPKQRSERRRAERCEHFTGTVNQTCKAGHSYAEFAGSLPCITLQAGQERPPCADRVLPTLEQLAEREQEMKRFLQNMSVARSAIVEHITERGRWKQNDAGSLPCPCCEGGALMYRYTGSYNGHIHANCTTEGCVSWME